jgi:hypothetical protein
MTERQIMDLARQVIAMELLAREHRPERWVTAPPKSKPPIGPTSKRAKVKAARKQRQRASRKGGEG